jgi:hypothetical protein
MSRKTITFLLIIGFLTTMAIISMPLASQAVASIFPETAVTETPSDPFLGEIAFLANELQSTELSVEAQILLQEKLNVVAREATQRAQGLIDPASRQIRATPLPVVLTRLPDGIEHRPATPAAIESNFEVLNAWRKHDQGHFYLVYAGYVDRNPDQGVLIVFHQDANRFVDYPTPDQSGGLKIIEEQGFVIMVQSINGSTYYFDAVSETYIDSFVPPSPPNTNPLPTALPEGTPTLAPYPLTP